MSDAATPDNAIGSVDMGGDPPVVATLLGEDRWRVTVGGVEEPIQARALVAAYLDHYTGPQDGFYGQLILRDLAERTGGKITWHQNFNRPAGPPGEQLFY